VTPADLWGSYRKVGRPGLAELIGALIFVAMDVAGGLPGVAG
jgi:hypothetical protein